MPVVKRPTLGCIGAECEHFKDEGIRPYCTAKRLNRMPEDFSGKMRSIAGGYYFYPDDAIRRGFCIHIPKDE